jgi:hypothetical protein
MPTEEQRKVFGTDCSTPNCMCIVQFIDGQPVKMEFVESLV